MPEIPEDWRAGTHAAMWAWARSKLGRTFMRAAGCQVVSGSYGLEEFLPRDQRAAYRDWCDEQGLDCHVL